MKSKKKKQPTPKQLKEKLWELCKRACREQYGNTCYTCGKTGLEGSGWHTAHFIPSGSCGALLRYNLRNLRPCCYHCNINLGGNGAVFYRKMVEREGQKYVDDLFALKNQSVKADVIFYQKLIDEYEDLLN